MKEFMDVAVLEKAPVDASGSPDHRFVHDLTTKQMGDAVEIYYTKDGIPGQSILYSVKDDGKSFTGRSSDEGIGGIIRVRPPIPADAIIMAPDAGIAQPLEVVNAQIKEEGGYLAQYLEAVVDPITDVLAVILRTGLGVYFRENEVWQLKRMDPRLAEGTTLQVLAPDAVEYWDNMGEEATIYDLPYMLEGERVDPSARDEATGPVEEV